MNLADASLAQLRAAFLNDAREFLRQIDHALADAARGDDAPQAFGQAGEALRGLYIGADFLDLADVCRLCREAQQQLLIQLPLLAPARAADTGVLDAIAARLHAALDADRSVAPPIDPPSAAIGAGKATPAGAKIEIAIGAEPEAGVAPVAQHEPVAERAPEPVAGAEHQAIAEPEAVAEPGPVAEPEAQGEAEPEAEAEAQVEAARERVDTLGSAGGGAKGACVEAIVVAPPSPTPCAPMLHALLQRVDALADGLREQRDALDALRPPSPPPPTVAPAADLVPTSFEFEVALARLGPWWLAWPASALLSMTDGDARRIALGGRGELWMYGRHALREAQLPAPWPPPRGVLRWPLDLPSGGVALRVDALEPPRTLRFDALPRELTARTGVRAVAALDHGDGALALLLDAQAFGHGAALAGDPSSGAVAPPDATRAGATAWLAFDVGAQCCGIDLRALCEIALPRPPVYPLPGADARLPGVSFWRGAALPLLDVGAVLDSRPSLARDGAQLMICEAEGERWGWIVDRVRGMRDLGRGDAITVGPGLPPPWDAARELLGGHGDDVCALLQPAALLRHALAPRGREKRR